MRCLLIEDGNRLILIDNGMGNKQDAKFFSYYYLHGNDSLDKNLSAHGFSRNDITDVLLTHLHFDHCGGSIIREEEKLVPAFKNAVYWSNEKHWEEAVNPNAREKASFLKENILPIKESGQLKFITETGNLTDSIFVRFVSGHTTAMMIPHIRYKEKTIVFMADLLPSVGHIPLPYVMAYDMRPLQTLKEKEEFLNRAVKENQILFFEHDPHVECCTLHQTEKGVRLKETFKLEHL
jgi:glyoxylase-like metal-dependent hydrolase (beta-lactamase superfamily II)